MLIGSYRTQNYGNTSIPIYDDDDDVDDDGDTDDDENDGDDDDDDDDDDELSGIRNANFLTVSFLYINAN